MLKRTLTVLALASLLAAACGQTTTTPTSTGPKHGDKLKIGIGITLDVVDPAPQTTTTVSQIVDMMAETLVAVNPEGKTVPLLAESWTPSTDGLEYTFTLRKGVKFHDGTDFNAAAVKFSIDRLLNPKTLKSSPGTLSVIDSTTAVDDTHVKFKLKSKYAPFVEAMTQTNAAIISPASVSIAGNTPERVTKVIGTGPYAFQEFTPNDHITLKINDKYWGQKPNYDVQEFRIIPDAAPREAALKAGQVDVIALPPASDIPALQKDSSVKVDLANSDRTLQIIINNQDTNQPLLKDQKVRQALNYAVDKNAIISGVLFGAGVPLDAPMAKSLQGYCSVGNYNYDQAKAKSMLAAAGASNLKVKMLAPTGRYVQDKEVAEAVADQLRKVGVTVEGPTTSDWGSYTAQIIVPPAQAKTDLHMLGWAPAYLDASQQFEQFYSKRWPAPPGQIGGLATSYYQNAQVDKLIEQGNSSTDANQRKQIYCDAAKLVWEDAPWIFLYNQKYPIVYSSRITGVQTLPNEKFVTTSASPK
jgi:peptide/nickel transport system substrate-binding protein